MTPEQRKHAPTIEVEGKEIADLRCSPRSPEKLDLFCPTDCIIIKTNRFIVLANVGFTDNRNKTEYKSNLENAVERSFSLLVDYNGPIDCRLISVSPFTAFAAINRKGLGFDPKSTKPYKYAIQKFQHIHDNMPIEDIISGFRVRG